MSYWMDFGAWEERHRELVREAERGRLAGGRFRDFIAGMLFVPFSRGFRG